MQKLTPEQAIYYLRLLRSARYRVLSDAENFRDVCFALEELGAYLLGKKKNGLGGYTDVFLEFLDEGEGGDFAFTLDTVRVARNDDAHEGVYARNSAIRAIDLSIKFEEKLIKYARKARHIMSESVIYAKHHYTLAKVRQIMLSSSFSFLPISREDGIYVLDDLSVSRVWHRIKPEDRYMGSFGQFIDVSQLPRAQTFDESTGIDDLLEYEGKWPVLVIDDSGRVVGIVTSFDLL